VSAGVRGEGGALEVDVGDLGPGDMRAYAHAGVAVLICNVDGEIYAVENVCSHAAVPLDEGELRGCEIECAFHGAVFDVRTGAALARPARDPIRSFPVERTGDRIRVRVQPGCRMGDGG